jgi:hypothetical protein
MVASQMGSWKPSRYGRTCPVKGGARLTDTAPSPARASEWPLKDVKRDMEYSTVPQGSKSVLVTCLSLGKGTAWPTLSGH